MQKSEARKDETALISHSQSSPTLAHNQKLEFNAIQCPLTITIPAKPLWLTPSLTHLSMVLPSSVAFHQIHPKRNFSFSFELMGLEEFWLKMQYWGMQVLSRDKPYHFLH